MARGLCRYLLQYCTRKGDFIIVDNVIHIRIYTFSDRRSHLSKNCCAFLHTLFGNGAVNVTCAEEDRSALERARVGPARSWRPHYATGKKHDPSIAIGVS